MRHYIIMFILLGGFLSTCAQIPMGYSTKSKKAIKLFEKVMAPAEDEESGKSELVNTWFFLYNHGFLVKWSANVHNLFYPIKWVFTSPLRYGEEGDIWWVTRLQALMTCCFDAKFPGKLRTHPSSLVIPAQPNMMMTRWWHITIWLGQGCTFSFMPL